MGKKTRRVTKKCLAAEAVASNEDLLLQILLRVPTRNVIRFKLVSTQWKSLISDQEFSRNHARMSRQMASSRSPSGLFLCTNRNQQHFVSLPVNNHSIGPPRLSELRGVARLLGCTLKVLQSCHGLLLCCFSCKFSDTDVENHMVYNPVTNETTIVPNPDHKWTRELQCFHLVFDPLESPHFKVVCLKILSPGNYYNPIYFLKRTYEVLIYSSQSDSWKSCCHFTPPPNVRSDNAVLWNGGIHWIGNRYLLRFHIDSESMTTLEMPRKPRGYCLNPTRYFGEWRGHLHLIQIRDQSTLQFRVLELDKDTLNWFVKYHRVHLGGVISAFPEVVRKKSVRDGDNNHVKIQYAFSVLAVVRGDREEDSALVLAIPGKVISYNLRSKLVTLLGEFPCRNPGEFEPQTFTAHQYIEILCPLKDHVTPFTTYLAFFTLNEEFRAALLASWRRITMSRLVPLLDKSD